jgi:hypothetical protein
MSYSAVLHFFDPETVFAYLKIEFVSADTIPEAKICDFIPGR